MQDAALNSTYLSAIAVERRLLIVLLNSLGIKVHGRRPLMLSKRLVSLCLQRSSSLNIRRHNRRNSSFLVGFRRRREKWRGFCTAVNRTQTDHKPPGEKRKQLERQYKKEKKDSQKKVKKENKERQAETPVVVAKWFRFSAETTLFSLRPAGLGIFSPAIRESSSLAIDLS